MRERDWAAHCEPYCGNRPTGYFSTLITYWNRLPCVSPRLPNLLRRGHGDCSGMNLPFHKKDPSMIQLKRVYEKPAKSDGERILVDRLWPRGLTKERAAVDLWLKEVAPSTELRKWFAHDPEKWKEFQTRYRKELRAQKEAIAMLRDKSSKKTVTLVYGARDAEHNEAVVLQRLIEA